MVMDMKLQMVDLHGQYLKIKKEMTGWDITACLNQISERQLSNDAEE